MTIVAGLQFTTTKNDFEAWSHVAVAAYGSSFSGRSRGSLCATQGPQGHLLSLLWTASDMYLLPSFFTAFTSSFFFFSSRAAAAAAVTSPLTPLLCPRDESSRLGRASLQGEWGGLDGARRRRALKEWGKGIASCGAGKRGRKGRWAKERGEEPRREATGSRESSYGTEGYMAVYYVLGTRVTYASVSPCIRKQAGVRFLLCVHTCVGSGAHVYHRILMRCVQKCVRAKAHFSRESLNHLVSKMWRTWNHATHVKNDPTILARKMEGRSERMVLRGKRWDNGTPNGWRVQEWRFEQCSWVE